MGKELSPACQTLVETYLATLAPRDRPRSVSADYFCADEHNANLCAELVATGRKRATASLAYWYRERGERMPACGDLLVVTDWHGRPRALVETISVELRPFNRVDAAFAAEEGEGDGSLAWWQAAHRRFFTQELAAEGLTFDETALLVLERFRRVALP